MIVSSSLFAIAFDPKFPYPEIETYQLDNGTDLYAMVYKPFNFDPSKKYPTILNIYGGPEVQLVVNSFRVCLVQLHYTHMNGRMKVKIVF